MDLGDNDLANIPAAVYMVGSLQRLRLDDNQITEPVTTFTPISSDSSVFWAGCDSDPN